MAASVEADRVMAVAEVPSGQAPACREGPEAAAAPGRAAALAAEEMAWAMVGEVGAAVATDREAAGTARAVAAVASCMLRVCSQAHQPCQRSGR